MLPWVPKSVSKQSLLVSKREMDPLFEALSLFRRRKYEKSCDICTDQLKKNPYDQVRVAAIEISSDSDYENCIRRSGH